MNAILLDTNAYAAFKRGDREAETVLAHAPLIALNTIVLGELYGGFAAGSREAENRQALADFLALPQVRLLPIVSETAEHYSALYVRLKAAGTPIPSNDLWIAASAREHSLDVFTYDRHFRMVPGLRVGSAPQDFGEEAVP